MTTVRLQNPLGKLLAYSHNLYCRTLPHISFDKIIHASLKGLPNAGKWIGYLERILILTFIFTGNIEGVGFLLAAKSVFRFGELNRAKDIKTTEYVLIGTFASFTISIMLGFGVDWLMEMNLE